MRIQTIRQRMLAGTMMGSAALMALVAAPALTLLTPATAFAQDYSSGTLSGRVVDTSGAPVAGAPISIRSNEQGVQRSATTDENGRFRLPLIPLGTYNVTITAPGFETISQDAPVRLGGESAYNFTLTQGTASNIDDIVVTGARPSLAFAQNTTGLSVDLEELVKTVPIARNITAVTLLAPSTVQGDATFGNLPAVGGGSVAENAFYVNGLNITNFDNYLGGSTVPFDFYRSVEVKTGGYPAEFGRATGGIINAVTKSGSNDFEFAIRGNYTPNDLRSTSPDTFQTKNSVAESDSYNVTIEAGGPIIPDRLFFFGLASLQSTETFSAGNSTGTSATATLNKQDDPFYGVKLDGYITDDHRVEFTYFDTTRETEGFSTTFNPQTGAVGTYPDIPTIGEAGGESYVARYTGQFTDWLTLSAAYGVNEDRNNSLPATNETFAQDNRGVGRGISPVNAFRISPNQTATTFSIGETKRTFYRGDADVFFSLFGDHHVRAGYELEETELAKSSVRTGPLGASLIYRRANRNTVQAQGSNLSPGQEYVEFNTFRNGGSFSGENEAFYIQDAWDVTEQLTLNLGVRLDKFRLSDSGGGEFVNFDSEIGPRLGFTYDPMNDGRSRLFGSFGRYYLPVASNTAFRGAANELSFSQYFLLGGYTPVAPGTFTGATGAVEQTSGTAIVAQRPYDANGLPLALGAQVVGYNAAVACPAGLGAPSPVGIRACTVTADGTVKDSSSFASENLETTMEEEFILGYERKVGDLWTFTGSLVYRDLVRSAEDVAIDAAVLALCDREGIVGCDDIYTGFHQYVVVNPGVDSTILLLDALPGETQRRTVDFTAEELNYPEATRTYTALELSFERAFDGVWALQGSWTLSKSEGNSEGYVNSTFGQSDAGITQDFDQPGLTEGTTGLLPNHRLHSFKLFGSYAVTPNLLVGANINVSSGRKFGCLGLHPTDEFAQAYGASSNYCNGQLIPRGTARTSDWTQNIDFSLRYTVPENFVPGNLVLRADLFNAFNLDGVTELYEIGENVNYLRPTNYQSPRSIRVGFDLEF